MTEQSALLLRKQLAGNILSRVDKANIRDVPSATDGGIFFFFLKLRLAMFSPYTSKIKKRTKPHNGLIYNPS